MFNFGEENIDYHYKVDSSIPYVCNGFLVIYDTNQQLQFIRISAIESVFYDLSDKCTSIAVLNSDSVYDTDLSAQYVFDIIKDYLV